MKRVLLRLVLFCICVATSFFIKTCHYNMEAARVAAAVGDAEPLRKALAAYMAKNVPQAASASFDGEASVDFNAKTVSASFHADDPARTVLVVAYADGKFTVSG